MERKKREVTIDLDEMFGRIAEAIKSHYTSEAYEAGVDNWCWSIAIILNCDVSDVVTELTEAVDKLRKEAQWKGNT